LWKNANVDTTFEEPINSNSRRTSGASITPMPERSIQFDTQSIMVSLIYDFAKIVLDHKSDRK
jgi:hypothetical protein